MKNIIYLTLFSVSLLLLSCSGGIGSNADDMISTVMKIEQNHLDNYNKIKRMTSDSTVDNFIDSIKRESLKSVYEVKGAVSSHVGILHGDMEKSLKLIDTYIDSLK
jgi:hypothetical protein